MHRRSTVWCKRERRRGPERPRKRQAQLETKQFLRTMYLETGHLGPGDSSRDLFIPDRWRSLNHLKGSRFHHPKKVTSRIARVQQSLGWGWLDPSSSQLGWKHWGGFNSLDQWWWKLNINDLFTVPYSVEACSICEFSGCFDSICGIHDILICWYCMPSLQEEW